MCPSRWAPFPSADARDRNWFKRSGPDRSSKNDGTHMSYILLACIFMGVATFATRAAPFLFGKRLKESKAVAYLGNLLPASIMLILVVYCLKDTKVLNFPFAIPEVVAIGCIIPLHLWKRNSLLSIATGTAIFIGLTLWLTT